MQKHCPVFNEPTQIYHIYMHSTLKAEKEAEDI